MLIRAAIADDIPAILAIEQSASSAAHWSAQQYEQRVKEGFVLVAEDNGSPCGFLCAHAVAGEWEIENVVVRPESRRRGVASALIEILLEKCEQMGGAAVLLEVRESNAGARSLYEKCGLQEVGRRRAYYRDPTEDAVLYTRQTAPQSEPQT